MASASATYDAASGIWRALVVGDGDAMSHLGHMHANGLGVKANNETALSLFKRAAEKGHAHAQYGLGRGVQRTLHPTEVESPPFLLRVGIENRHSTDADSPPPPPPPPPPRGLLRTSTRPISISCSSSARVIQNKHSTVVESPPPPSFLARA
jgi:hypothetical protein